LVGLENTRSGASWKSANCHLALGVLEASQTMRASQPATALSDEGASTAPEKMDLCASSRTCVQSADRRITGVEILQQSFHMAHCIGTAQYPEADSTRGGARNRSCRIHACTFLICCPRGDAPPDDCGFRRKLKRFTEFRHDDYIKECALLPVLAASLTPTIGEL